MSRAWFGIIFESPLSFVSPLFLYACYNCYDNISTHLIHVLCYNWYDNISAQPKDPWVGGRHCVSVVLIRCLPMDTPYILGHVVDRGCDTPIESFVVHSPM